MRGGTTRSYIKPIARMRAHKHKLHRRAGRKARMYFDLMFQHIISPSAFSRLFHHMIYCIEKLS